MEKEIKNQFPRPLAADATLRPACEHDPAGILVTCDICNFSCLYGRLGICVNKSKGEYE